jgi:hypothetical protein
MALINYKGKIAPLVILLYKGATVPGSILDRKELSKATDEFKSFPYLLANDNVEEFAITGKVNNKEYILAAKKSKKVKILGKKAFGYFPLPILGESLNALIESPSTTWKIDLKISFFSFFYYMIVEMTSRDKSNYNNLANPSASTRKTILDSLNYRWTGKKVQVKYKTQSKHILNVPMRLDIKKITPNEGEAPDVILIFTMDLSQENFIKIQRTVMCQLIAADYTSLLNKKSALRREMTLKEKKSKKAPLTKLAEKWHLNIQLYLMNHTDFDRGKQLLNRLYDNSIKLTPKQISYKLRDDIDEYLITANHWGQRRENWGGKETYQRILSDAFGAIDQSQWWVSPVGILRHMIKWLNKKFEEKGLQKLALVDQASLIIQCGTANCGDHAFVSLVILGSMAKSGRSDLEDVINSGQANVDHQFVVYGLQIAEFITTTVRSPLNTTKNPDTGDPIKIGDETKVWDLKEAIESNKWLNRKGYIMDPYLDPKEIGRTAEELLNKILRNKIEKKRTHFLAYFDKYPPFSDKTYTGKIEASVMNV